LTTVLCVNIISVFIAHNNHVCIFDYCFFFQAEDGIRDKLVTGVQTCALPISSDCERSAYLSNDLISCNCWSSCSRAARLDTFKIELSASRRTARLRSDSSSARFATTTSSGSTRISALFHMRMPSPGGEPWLLFPPVSL